MTTTRSVLFIWVAWALLLGLAIGYGLGYWRFGNDGSSESDSQPAMPTDLPPTFVSSPTQPPLAECPTSTSEAPSICETVPSLEIADDYLARAIDLWQRGYYAIPVSDVNKAIELDPTLANAYFYRGWIAHEGYRDKRNRWHTDINSALEGYSRAIELDPDHARAYNNRGMAYLQRGKYEAALADFQRAVEIDPDYGNANFNLIHIALTLKKETDALEYCRNWYERTQTLSAASCLRIADRQGDYAFLVDMLSRNIEYYQEIGWPPGLFENYSLRGRAYLKWGHYEEARADLEQAIEMGKEERISMYGNAVNVDLFTVYLDAVNVTIAQGDVPRALSELSTLILEYPQEIAPYQMRADLYYEQGSYAQALLDYYQVQGLQYPPDDEIAEQIAEIEQRLADTE